MIQMQTKLNVADNSGAKLVQCIKVLGGSNHYSAGIAQVVVVSVKSATSTGKVKKGDVHRAVIVRVAKEIKREDGSQIKFDENAVVLVNKHGEPVGTRVFGPIAREIKLKKFLKIASLAPEVL